MDELLKLGYRPITPRGNKSPIVASACPDPDDTVRRLKAADVHAALRFGNKIRISPSVYNNQDDVTRLLTAPPIAASAAEVMHVARCWPLS